MFLDGFIGALLGALITGAAQIWAYYRGRKDARADQSLNAARELLVTVHESIQILRLLPHTSNPAGSPLSYGERLATSRPMRDAQERAIFVTVPLITDAELARRFREFTRICDHVSGPHVDAKDIHEAVRDAEAYGNHVRECLIAHLDSKPLPAEQRASVAGVTPDS
jgi:hypothetical protein